MGRVRNILFIMCDQLRADYLSCAGHPTLHTPNIDALAQRGVRFSRAFVQSPVCGPSRMSFYTGRYMCSHGATWNGVPLSTRELTLGDYLRPAGVRVALLGKTHMAPDAAAMARLGIDPASAAGALLGEAGFEALDRFDGHPPRHLGAYADYLRSKGYDSADPWSDFVIAAEDADGNTVSGWNMRNARLPAKVREADSETAYMTDRAIDFIAEQGDQPWCLHLSYIKPHWPYIAPAPYHAMYSPNQCTPVRRDPRELDNAHPVVTAYRRLDESVAFARDEVVRAVKPTYMGLVKQIDDHLGRLFRAMEADGRMDDTLILFTSDHGDFLGDHYLGEKELFYEEALRVPFIVYDPDPAADVTRGTVDERFVESIDVVPSFLEALGVAVPSHIIEGRSLLPLLRGGPVVAWRDAVFSELDYAFRKARHFLGRGPQECRAHMIREERWKYVEWQGFRPQLFDLDADPDEFNDLGADPAFEAVRAGLRDRLLAWLASRKQRVTIGDDIVEQRTGTAAKRGNHIGVW